MKIIAVVVAILGICLSNWATPSRAGTGEGQAASTEERQAIEATLLQYEKTLNESDVKGVLELYAPDGVFMPSGAPSATGTDEIKAAYEHVFASIKLDIKFTIDEIVQCGN
ncbi:MAG: SgcJ/EcaC family oxidoreductase, partial [Candidatus Krumholzibacteriota bacterium]|nr:SgcJ/EcaC family oxidoreductase [Candidatus Krumholzibacteriota bacterium]